MLASIDTVPMVAVKDLKAAKNFYQNILGLELVDTYGEDMLNFKSGETLINVYRSEFAGTNKATTLSWAAGDRLDDMVQSLKKKGVSFEHYDMPDMKRQGDIHMCGDMRVVWFKDPDGNILSITNH